MQVFLLIAVAVGCYILGSIPSSYIAGKLSAGINIMEHGSGNAGATNTVRVLGFKIGLIVFFADAVKGALAAWFGYLVFDVNGAVICGAVAILGHTYSLFLHFKGGKGVATAAGVLAFLQPWLLIIALTFWFVLGFLTNYVSLASIGACLLAITLSFVMTDHLIVRLLVVLACGYIVIKHYPNIRRLLNGTESKVDWFHPLKNARAKKRDDERSRSSPRP